MKKETKILIFLSVLLILPISLFVMFIPDKDDFRLTNPPIVDKPSNPDKDGDLEHNHDDHNEHHEILHKHYEPPTDVNINTLKDNFNKGNISFTPEKEIPVPIDKKTNLILEKANTDFLIFRSQGNMITVYNHNNRKKQIIDNAIDSFFYDEENNRFFFTKDFFFKHKIFVSNLTTPFNKEVYEIKEQKIVDFVVNNNKIYLITDKKNLYIESLPFFITNNEETLPISKNKTNFSSRLLTHQNKILFIEGKSFVTIDDTTLSTTKISIQLHNHHNLKNLIITENKDTLSYSDNTIFYNDKIFNQFPLINQVLSVDSEHLFVLNGFDLYLFNMITEEQTLVRNKVTTVHSYKNKFYYQTLNHKIFTIEKKE